MSTSINDDLMSGGKLQAALFSTDASGNVTGLAGPNGAQYGGVHISVPNATGDADTDTANINAAILAAGDGSVVEFPANQTYLIANYLVGAGAIPAKLIGHNTTLKAAAQTSTTLGVGQSITTGGSQSFTVADATQLAGASFIVASTGAGSYSNAMLVSSIVGNTVTVSSAVVAGTLSGAGVTITPVNNLMLVQFSAATEESLEISGFIFDGNAANRTANRQWSSDELLKFNGGYGSKVWVHHCIFKDAPCEAISANSMSYIHIDANHFENIMGSGVHPGGTAGSHVDFLCTNNTFKDVFQLTTATTPTAQNYGHVTGQGAMAASVGPARAVWQGNIVDGSTAYGIHAGSSSTNTDLLLSGNMLYNCARGGFRVDGASEKITITGNEVYACGHDTLDISTATIETTAVYSSAKKAVVCGNTFIDSQLALLLDSGDLAVSGNYFSSLGKQYGANGRELASILLGYSSSQNSHVAITGNVLRGPKNATESTAVANTPFNGIQVSRSLGVLISGNTIVGHRHGIHFGSSVYRGLSTTNNIIMDQFNSGGTNAHGIYSGASTTMNGCSFSGNQFYLTESGTAAWTAIEFGLVTTAIGNSISNNNITAPTANTGNGGILLNANTTGFAVTDNQIYLGYGASAYAIRMASATSAIVCTNNVIRNSCLTDYGSATVAAGNQAV